MVKTETKKAEPKARAQKATESKPKAPDTKEAWRGFALVLLLPDRRRSERSAQVPHRSEPARDPIRRKRHRAKPAR